MNCIGELYLGAGKKEVEYERLGWKISDSMKSHIGFCLMETLNVDENYYSNLE